MEIPFFRGIAWYLFNLFMVAADLVTAQKTDGQPHEIALRLTDFELEKNDAIWLLVALVTISMILAPPRSMVRAITAIVILAIIVWAIL